MYGSRKSRKGGRGSRSGGSKRGSRGARRSMVGGKVSQKRLSARFATVGFARDCETKYSDKAIKHPGYDMVSSVDINGSVSGWSDDDWFTTNFGIGSAPYATVGAQDLLKGVVQGVTATSRIGNKIWVKQLRVKISVVAATKENAVDNYENAQYGESIVDTATGVLSQFMRTTYRIMIVKDLQVNANAKGVMYNEVMENSTVSGFRGVHSELKVENMGRFRVLSDRLVELDADNPMRTLSMNFNGIGAVRYNGPENAGGSFALTDHGIHVIFATYCGGVKGTGITLKVHPVNVSRRLIFTDC